MFRKWIAGLLILMICFGCGAAPAEENSGTVELPMMGISVDVPAIFGETQGVISSDGAMELAEGSGVYYAYLYYCAVSREEFDRLFEENIEALISRTSLICYLFAVGEKKDYSAVTALVGDALPAENAVQVGQAGDYTCYLYMAEDPEFAASLDEAYGAEYTAACASPERIAAGITCTEPLNEYSRLDGTVIRFEGTDLDGQPVSSEELFAQHEITMVNIWATWCGPCVSELKDLQEIHTGFLEKDCCIVGLMIDNNLEEARRLIEENGMTYAVVLAPKNFDTVFPYSAVPTSFFVDRNGVYLGEKIVGVDTQQYAKTLDALLNAAGK